MRHFKKGAFFFFIVLLAACTGGPRAVSGDRLPAQYHLTVLHTNDFHGEDYSTLAREAALIKMIRIEEKNVLYLDAGDTFTRGKYHKVFYGELEFAALNAMGCQALTLGNNEFKAADSHETAQEYLFERIEQAVFPVLCANVKWANDGSYLQKVKPYVVIPVNGVKIGIVGVSANRISGYGQIKGFVVEEPIDAAIKIVPLADAEADLVLALTHIGFDEDCRLAEAQTKIKAIIGGDSHTVLPEPVVKNKTPIVQAGGYGRYLGRLDLYFELQNGEYILKDYKGILIPLDEKSAEDPAIRAIIDSYLQKVEKEAA